MCSALTASPGSFSATVRCICIQYSRLPPHPARKAACAYRCSPVYGAVIDKVIPLDVVTFGFVESVKLMRSE
jgi:hypothetical protein